MHTITKPNGALVKEKVNCDHCGKVSKMSNGPREGNIQYAYYVFNKEKLCRGCSKRVHCL